MKKMCRLEFVFLLFFLSLTTAKAQQTSTFDGVATDHKIILINPLSDDLFGTCISRVTINGEIYPLNISQNIVSIDLRVLGIRKGDLFTMQIDHEEDCSPYIYNKSDFRLTENSTISELHIQGKEISWQTQNEIVPGDFQLEIKFNGNWVTIATIAGKGIGSQIYTAELPFVFSGKNYLRLSKTKVKTRYNYFTVFSMPEQHYSVSTTTADKHIYLLKDNKPTKVYFQLKDIHGVIVKSGVHDMIDVSNLKPGFYTLFLDNHQIVVKVM